MTRFFFYLYDFFSKKRKWMWISLGVVTLLLAFSAANIHFSEDISDFLPQNSNNKMVNYAYSHIGGSNTILVSFSMTDTAMVTDNNLIISAIDLFVNNLSASDASDYIKSMEYSVDQQRILSVMDFVTENMPLFLNDDDFARMDTLITAENIEYSLSSAKGLLLTPMGSVIKHNIGIDPLSISSPLLNSLKSFQISDSYQLYDDYIFSKDMKKGILTINSKYSSSETRKNGYLMRSIDKAISQTSAEMEGGITIIPFGSSYIAETNSSQIIKDSILSVGLALIMILALLLYYFRSPYPVVMVIIPILFGMLFSIGCISLFNDKVSIIAISIGSIMVGIAANYPLHYLTHRYQGFTDRQTLSDITKPLTTGNITTVGAFLSLLFISSAAMRNLGLFASLLLLGAILFVLIFLPHLIGSVSSRGGKLAFPHISKLRFEESKYTLVSIILITIFLSFFNSKVSFDSNMSNINYMTPIQRDQMSEMISQVQGNKHVVYYVNQAESIDDALSGYENSLMDISYIADGIEKGAVINNIGRFIPSLEMQQYRVGRWNQFWKSRSKDVIAYLDRYSDEFHFSKNAFDRFKKIITTEYSPKEYDFFRPITEQLASPYISYEDGKALVYSVIHIDASKSDTLIGALNKYDDNAGFAFDAGSATRAMVSNLSEDFDYVLYICGFIVFVFLLISFGRIELTAITFLPLALSWIWILGLMGILGMNFNIVNIILATFIFGMGDDYTIFITEGMLYENAYRKRMVDTYKDTVMLSALIMFAGIGTLIFAKHPALKSLAQVTIVGMFSVVLMAYSVTPALFRWLTMKKGKRRKQPITLYNLSVTVLSFLVFLFLSLAITLYGFVLLTLFGKTQRHKLRYHRLLQNISRRVIEALPGTSFSCHNNPLVNFDKPSVIIANHQSHLDLMGILMLHPKIIVITNDWVWHSPFYGVLIRYADFFPIERVLASDSRIKEMVGQGYSIMFFPEGTRSEDETISRFHKGAFYVSKEFKLDIVPVVLHGFGKVLSKDSLLVHRGAMSVNVLPRIPYEEAVSAETFADQAKNMRKYFIGEYKKIALKVETADYYASEVIHNYIYKGTEVEREVKENFRRNGNFASAIQKLPDFGIVHIEDSGYGEYALLLSLVKKELTIFATIEDDRKRAIAENCVSKPDNLHFIKNEQ